jgi:hypothetical protein
MLRNSEVARGIRRAGSAVLSLGALATTALAPKCPFCIVAFLSAAGLGGAGARHVAPLLRPLAITLGLVVAVSVVWAERRRARRHVTPCCRQPAISFGSGVLTADRPDDRPEGFRA